MRSMRFAQHNLLRFWIPPALGPSNITHTATTSPPIAQCHGLVTLMCARNTYGFEASWRQLPLITPFGFVVHSTQRLTIHGDFFDYIQGFVGADIGYPVEGYDEPVYEPPGGVRLGWLYHLIITHNASYPNSLGNGWRILFDTRVRDAEECWRISSSNTNKTTSELATTHLCS